MFENNVTAELLTSAPVNSILPLSATLFSSVCPSMRDPSEIDILGR